MTAPSRPRSIAPRRRHILLLALAAWIATPGPATAQFSADSRLVEPEAKTGITARPALTAGRHMIVTANPLASDAGLQILREGGSAVDAAIAVQMVLTLVEPQSSGIGGGAFLVTYDAATRAVDSIDGRETAPMAARPDRFLGVDGRPRPFSEIVASPASVGVPGVLRALEAAHARHGKLPWPRLFAPAIALAEQGFTVTPRLATLLSIQGRGFFNPQAQALYFQPDGRAIATGAVLKNPALAETLREIAARGATALHSGPLADKILATLAARGPSDLTADDLARYEAKARAPLCFPHTGRTVCSMGPPSSGGIAMAMIFGLLDTTNDGAPATEPSQPVSSAGAIFRTRLDAIRRLVEAVGSPGTELEFAL